jgi:SAM-dependent methyltransferase
MSSAVNSALWQVYEFWNRASCGEELYLASPDRAGYEAQARARYELEPDILEFARFEETRGVRVLEIGVGLGADHQRFAAAGADLYGMDLTERAVEHTRRRLAAFGLASNLTVGDAEALDFPDEQFNLIYSWGVLHHTPDTPQAISEVWRVLKPAGVARIMLYHKWSLVGLMLWLRYGLLALRLCLTLTSLYARYLESPGTKAYSVAEARRLFSAFREVRIRTVLTHGDLLESAEGQRHRGWLLGVARKIWPRWFIRRFFPKAGLFMLIEAKR